MGEFLLSILTLNDAGVLVYSRQIPFAKFKAGDEVPTYYPHGNRGDMRPCYRICQRAYNPAQIMKLIETQNPDIIDRNMKTAYQRELQDRDIHAAVATGTPIVHVAYVNKWTVPAVREAIARHNARARVKPVASVVSDDAAKERLKQTLSAWDIELPS